MNFELPFFNRNQGEIARTGYALTQAQEQQQAASDTVLSDVSNAYEAVRSNDEVVQLYTSGYLKQAQDSRDISEYAYKRGAASLLDFLDARAQLPVRSAGLSPGAGIVYDGIGATEGSGGDEEPAMNMRSGSLARVGCIRRGVGDHASARRLPGLRIERRCQLGQREQLKQSRAVYHSAGPDVACPGTDHSAHNAELGLYG